ncbi:hypothetical protein OROHE_000283 [Orobanche hederae]
MSIGGVDIINMFQFNLISVVVGTYKLRLAIASATRSDLEVHVNEMNGKQIVF